MEESRWAELEQMRGWTVNQLRHRYRQVFGVETRSSHREFLFRKLAWKAQCAAEGDLSERAQRRAAELANDDDLRLTAPRVRHWPAAKRPAVKKVGRPTVGTQLRREYRGRTIVVDVQENGFRYDGRQFGSLSAIAREVTGTQWNGKVFFGLKRRGQA